VWMGNGSDTEYLPISLAAVILTTAATMHAAGSVLSMPDGDHGSLRRVQLERFMSAGRHG
jgi:hypothetical protein